MKSEQYDDLLEQIDKGRLPNHIAVIMDGNGRWAAQRHLPRSAGHKAGAEAMRRVTEICREIGVPYLSVYAFSTENWKRSSDEVGFLMKLLVQYLRKEIDLMNKQEVRLAFLGRRDGLSDEVLAALDDAVTATKNNAAMQLSLAINYGSRDELCRAVQKLARCVKGGSMSADDIDEQTISAALDTCSMPDPDLLIRPSGELRLSNFLLWQCAYSEFYFNNVLWPDFSKRDLLTAIIDFQQRDRRFGGRKSDTI